MRLLLLLAAGARRWLAGETSVSSVGPSAAIRGASHERLVVPERAPAEAQLAALALQPTMHQPALAMLAGRQQRAGQVMTARERRQRDSLLAGPLFCSPWPVPGESLLLASPRGRRQQRLLPAQPPPPPRPRSHPPAV